MKGRFQLGKWGTDIPRKGWVLVTVEDTGEPSHECEMCEQAECRYVHHMIWVDVVTAHVVHELACGSSCAEHMSEDYTKAKGMIAALKRRQRMTEEGLLRAVLAGRKLIAAKYPGRCSDCRRTIQVGESLAWSPNGAPRLCSDCVDRRVASARVTVRPEELRR